MSLPVSLDEIVGDLQMQMDVSTVYLNEETGETLMVQDEEARQADALAQGEIDEGDLPEWQKDLLPRVYEAVHEPEWLTLPSQWDIHEYEMMEKFCYSIEDDDHREQLLRAIQGKGAFRYFRDTCDRLGLTEDWYAFRDQAYEEIAVRWLEARDIPYVRDDEEN
jgi:hypothetical protein